MANDAPLDLEALGIRADGVSKPRWFDINQSSAPLTEAAVLAAVEKLYNERTWEPCRHVVHPDAEGWTACAMCFKTIFVVRDEQGRLHAR